MRYRVWVWCWVDHGSCIRLFTNQEHLLFDQESDSRPVKLLAWVPSVSCAELQVHYSQPVAWLMLSVCGPVVSLGHRDRSLGVGCQGPRESIWPCADWPGRAGGPAALAGRAEPKVRDLRRTERPGQTISRFPPSRCSCFKIKPRQQPSPEAEQATAALALQLRRKEQLGVGLCNA